jgi:hypothetical protein
MPIPTMNTLTLHALLFRPAALSRRSVLCALGLGLTLAFSSSARAQSNGRIVTVTEQVRLGVPPARAWAAIEDFLTWPSWHPAFSSTRLLKGDGHSAGTVRLLAARDGAVFTEELLVHDDQALRLQYRILESPAPVVGYRSTLSVKPDRSGSTVTWSSDFKVKPGTSEAEVRQLIAGIYRQGLDHLAGAFE